MASTARPDHWLTCRDKQDWHDWLAENHGQASEVWLFIRKAGADANEIPGIPLGDAVTEAIRFGWIDSRMYSLDADGYILRFTPRKPDSNWSLANRTLAESMIADGSMAPSGLAAVRAGQASGKWQVAYTAREEPDIPADLAAALQADPEIRAAFSRWAPSMKFQYIYWINEAKRPETRRNRIGVLIAILRKPSEK